MFVPCGLTDQRATVRQLLNAAAGKECSREPDEIQENEAYLLLSKGGTSGAGNSTGKADPLWDGPVLKLVPQMETVDTLKAMKVKRPVAHFVK